MQIHISPRQVKLTAAIHSYVADKVGHLEHFDSDIIGAHVAICHDEGKAKHAFVVKVHLALPGPDLHAEDHGHELYPAIDLVTEKLAEQLRHRKSKLTRGSRDAERKEKEKRKSVEIDGAVV
ncbi:MAG: ribosome-associated translation inhibitor RaiA [Candidatus Methylacidiphilales bacterium]|nr:ribosome-associated translation inhibitor RaiA [Candidatus Methylacidiphilales bacterium]